MRMVTFVILGTHIVFLLQIEYEAVCGKSINQSTNQFICQV